MGRSIYDATIQTSAGQFISAYVRQRHERSDFGEFVMYSQAMINLNTPVANTKIPLLTGLVKRLGAVRFTRGRLKPSPASDNDPLLLVLLADFEISEGRKEQARHLVEAAYAAFDKKA